MKQKSIADDQRQRLRGSQQSPGAADSAESELLKAARMVESGQIAAEAVHELNNLLGAALGYVQLARESQMPSSAPADYLLRIEDRITQAANIIRDLTGYGVSKQSRWERVFVNNVLREAVDVLSAQNLLQGIAVHYSLSPHLPTVVGDSLRLSQVFLNLLRNATEAMPQGGEIHIQTFHEAGKVNVLVSDSGVGIREEDLGRIFEPFFTTKLGHGLGVGLALSERIIREHGGTIALESRQGRGSTFIISLPAAVQSEIPVEGK